MSYQNQNNRLRAEDDSYRLLPPILSISQLETISTNVSVHRDEFINILSKEKETGIKVKLWTLITCFCDAYHKVSVAYSHLLGSESAATRLRADVHSVVDHVKTSRESLDVISSTVQNVAATQDRSYASIVKASASPDNRRLRNLMILDKGKTLPIRSSSQVIIGPSDPSSDTIATSETPKAKLLEIIKPADVGLRITRIFLSANKSVIVEGDPCNSAILRNFTPLIDAGLEVKDKVKYNPRLIVHDVPADLSSDDIRGALHKQNFPDNCIEDFKIVYLFPLREGKKSRSCIIETTPECRKSLCASNRVYIGLRSCRCADHISILQCYNCHNFGHIAKDCSLEAPLCGFCAGPHSSKNCTTKTTLCCSNCKYAKSSDSKHAAFDRIKCPLFRAKLSQKSASINYGI